MFPNFLPQTVGQLTEPASITLAQNIQTTALTTPLTNEPITTAYVKQGSGGTPILLIHGFDSSVLEFRRLLPLLAGNNETWAVDLLGFGFTDRLSGIAYSPSAIKIHLYDFWKSLINQPVILVGASMGGATAIDLALSYPELVKKLVLIDSAGLAGGSPLSKLMFPPLDYLATQFLSNMKVRDRIARIGYKNQSLASLDALYCSALHLQMPNWHQALIAFTKSGGYSAFRFKKISQILQPTLILWGDSDKILGIKDAIRFKRAIPQSTLIWIQDCGHLPHLEQPQITAQNILKFSSE
ncbi:2-hydroxy-6-oxohepta-2,4-dienoate hydrolase [Nostoc linckia z18]|jgi:pimeloyl-ACP methyl ester carboxylesterase|uniref:2-hydroxy-6-oxohepta-2,4-dienoate hydrolase n=2 Tax=Nostoc linckia TaxID=92942 RepID=A0A9Q5ZGW3_NOSLI|nr:alpha/beta hydrolase [Nostoc linckia]PHK30879.1 2-hydroxy-6-oxohepta-2,4-dienoate hydrolase [Nostoc linckia z15]PHK48233.1 2-hydroxy-6-oxohepta-2,4-dienoate hydrolase [Nostoc linckia z16]PHJ68332.1 2-hydroxy-6-oxohepta-2,4-dienoate hydrolase [Nostoc linckia z1]PHJ73768.1 2-hydroxy-6-oxohepta-2,4-dienoate hydrolase [Nostoc linckia z3]PHJ78337.1 2-hydroxy-6-oxohepta-2,4-dienoate hydrolase [Nostoc linckia z2]